MIGMMVGDEQVAQGPTAGGERLAYGIGVGRIDGCCLTAPRIVQQKGIIVGQHRELENL
jgi:hypothetical protein